MDNNTTNNNFEPSQQIKQEPLTTPNTSPQNTAPQPTDTKPTLQEPVQETNQKRRIPWYIKVAVIVPIVMTIVIFTIVAIQTNFFKSGFLSTTTSLPLNPTLRQVQALAQSKYPDAKVNLTWDETKILETSEVTTTLMLRIEDSYKLTPIERESLAINVCNIYQNEGSTIDSLWIMSTLPMRFGIFKSESIEKESVEERSCKEWVGTSEIIHSSVDVSKDVTTEEGEKVGEVEIHVDTDLEITTSCGSYDCFKQQFTKCQPATAVSKLSDDAVYKYEIIGPENNLCRVVSKFTANPNPTWINKEMSCLYDSALGFEEAIGDTSNCQGELYILMTGG